MVANPGPECWWSKDTVAVVTGANKGIGYEIVRLLAKHGLTVILTSRDAEKGQAAVEALKAEGLESIKFHPLEVTSSESVEKFKSWLQKEFPGGIDILVNNAGIFPFKPTNEGAEAVIATNYYGVKNVTTALLPLLRASPAGARIVNVSSRAGLYSFLTGESLKVKFRDEGNYSEDFADSMAAKYLEDLKAGRVLDEGWMKTTQTAYGESKLFLDTYAVALAESLLKGQPPVHQIFVLSFCPGCTETDMLKAALEKGLKAPVGFPMKTAADGADTGVWLALLPKHEAVEKTGKFFADRKEYPLNMVLHI